MVGVLTVLIDNTQVINETSVQEDMHHNTALIGQVSINVLQLSISSMVLNIEVLVIHSLVDVT